MSTKCLHTDFTAAAHRFHRARTRRPEAAPGDDTKGAAVVHSLWSKVLAIVGVALALVVALDRISALVAEREGRLREAEASVAASLATHQELTGPVLQRRCEETWSVDVG